MKTLIFALLLGVAGSVFAADVSSTTVKTPQLVQTDMRKREIMVPDFSDDNGELKEEDLEGLMKYSNIVTPENVALIRRLQKKSEEDPAALLEQMQVMNPNWRESDQDEAARELEKAMSQNSVEELHKQALEQLERIGRPNMAQPQVSIQQIPSIEEIKKMGLDQHLPDGWEDLLKNSEEFKAEMKRRRAAESKANVKQTSSKTAKPAQKTQQKRK